MSDWNSSQYLKFERERTQPAFDLARRVENASPSRILDLGCGPGNSTRVLRTCFPDAELLGADHSPDMIERARRDYPELKFQLFDATEDLAETGAEWSLIFSNACLQWVPDHRTLLPRLLSALRPGGELAVQIPLQQKAPFHTLLGEVTARRRWKAFFAGEARPFHLLDAAEYCDILTEYASSFVMWETDYYHILPSHRAVLDWYRGTGLRPYLNALPEEEKQPFEQELLTGTRTIFPQRKNGTVLFRFARLFFIATRRDHHLPDIRSAE